jgi:hypothetical protein
MSHNKHGKNAGAPQQQSGQSARVSPNNPAEDLAKGGLDDINEGQEQMQATGQGDEGTFDPHMQNGTKLRRPGKDVGINNQGAQKQAPSDEL